MWHHRIRTQQDVNLKCTVFKNTAPEGNNARKLSKNSTRFRLKCVQMSAKAKFTRKFGDDVAKVRPRKLFNKLGKTLYVDYSICSATGNVRTSTKPQKEI